VRTTNLLELQRLSGQDNGFPPVEEVSLSFAPGQSHFLMGTSDSGSGSLLRLIAGFGTAASGHVLYNGHDLSGIPPRRRPFTLLTARDALFPHMTVSRNVSYGLNTRDLERSELDHRIESVLHLAGIDGRGDAMPDDLTAGERQQVALARALAVEPLVLLMDEALSYVDPAAVGRIMTGLRSLRKDVGFTLITATADGALAMAFADRIVVMREGRIVEQGSPRMLYDSPRSALTARLTGPANLIPGHVLRDLPRHDVSKQTRDAAKAGDRRALLVRPDTLDLHLVQPDAPAIVGHVASLAYSPAGMAAHIRIDGMPETLIARVDTPRLDPDDLPEGRRVWCTWADELARVVPLDPEIDLETGPATAANN